MKLTVLAAVSLALFAGGCHVTTGSDHTLVSDLAQSIPAGYCGPINVGPFYLPDGTINDYTVTDNDGTDLMDVTIIDYATYGCSSLGLGYGTEYAVTSVSSGTGSVPAGYYDFVVRCDNSVLDCQFFVTWTANY
jgi:hypothetical protein